MNPFDRGFNFPFTNRNLQNVIFWLNSDKRFNKLKLNCEADELSLFLGDYF